MQGKLQSRTPSSCLVLKTQVGPIYPQVIALAESGSLAVLSSVIDSSLDLFSGAVVWYTSRTMHRWDRQKYPTGKTRLEPLATVIIAGEAVGAGDVFHVVGYSYKVNRCSGGCVEILESVFLSGPLTHLTHFTWEAVMGTAAVQIIIQAIQVSCYHNDPCIHAIPWLTQRIACKIVC